MRNQRRFWQLLMMILIWLTASTVHAEDIRGDKSLAMPFIKQLITQYNQQHPEDAARFHAVGGNVLDNGEAFGRGRCKLLMSFGPVSGNGLANVMSRYLYDSNPKEWESAEIGQLRVMAVVHASNPMTQLSFPQVQSLLSKTHGMEMTWQDLGGKGGLVTCYGEHDKSFSRAILKQYIMRFRNRKDPEAPNAPSSGTLSFRDNFALCASAEEVIEEIARDPMGIGFISYAGPLPANVKVIALAETTDSKAVTPKLDIGEQPNYPLSQPVILYLHPDAGREARQFFEWAREHRLQAADASGHESKEQPSAPPAH